MSDETLTLVGPIGDRLTFRRVGGSTIVTIEDKHRVLPAA